MDTNYSLPYFSLPLQILVARAHLPGRVDSTGDVAEAEDTKAQGEIDDGDSREEEWLVILHIHQ